jgi:hypothetical protein
MGVKNLALLASLPLMAAGALAVASPAQAATFDSGQLDFSNLGAGGNAIYTKNAIDFTRANRANGTPISNPGQSGFINVDATGDLNSLRGQAQIFDLFSPVEITSGTRFTFAPGSLKFLEFAEGTEYFVTALTRTGSNTGVQNFEFEGYFLNDGDQTFSTFAFITGQAPVPISSTTLLTSIDQIDDRGVRTGFTSYSATIITPPIPEVVPEPASVLGLLAFGSLAASGVIKRKKA